MYIITTGVNSIRFNATEQILYSGYILEIDNHLYTADITLAAPTINNDRYIAFDLEQKVSPDLSAGEMYLPAPGDYFFSVYNTDGTKADGIIIFNGIMRLEATETTDTNWTNSQTDKAWVT